MAVRAVLVAHQRAGFMTVRGQFLGAVDNLGLAAAEGHEGCGVATVSI